MFQSYLKMSDAAGEVDGLNRVFATERCSALFHNGMLLNSDDYSYDAATGMSTLTHPPLVGDRIQYLSVIQGSSEKWELVQ